jgi:hypothetical protein
MHSWSVRGELVSVYALSLHFLWVGDHAAISETRIVAFLRLLWFLSLHPREFVFPFTKFHGQVQVFKLYSDDDKHDHVINNLLIAP